MKYTSDMWYSIDKIGVFVRFLGSFTGLATRTECIHLFGKEPEDLFYIGQTVQAKVINVDKNRKRFGLTLRRSQLHKKPSWLTNIWISSLFNQLSFVYSK
eukprot:UN05639